MRDRDFNKEFFFFLNKIKNNESFCLSRWGDGELKILENEFIDLRNKKNGEFRYDPKIKEYEKLRNKLFQSYISTDNKYYIGVACSCCVGQNKYEYMKNISHQDEEHLTWANIFVNSNYKHFVNCFIPEMSNHKIIMVVNEKADTSKLSFGVETTYHIGTDAWFNDFNLMNKIKDNHKTDKNKIFLFAAGPFANILTYELWFNMNKNNTYLDIGSTLDVQMGMKATRGYHKGAPTLKKICIW